MAFTKVNHYVPQWYQRRFIPQDVGEKKLFYLDLKPEQRLRPDGTTYTRRALRRLGTANCFALEHLYTLFFRKHASDIVEKKFFGEIDHRGAEAVAFFSDYDIHRYKGKPFEHLIYYLDAQKLRTPKGLDYLKHLSGTASHQAAVETMGRLWRMHSTIWSEGVWEVVCCDNSAARFIISDHPVATYNKKLFPLSKECRYPLDARIELLGTHTIFALSPTRCLVITNLGYVRNPWAHPLKVRENPRRFGETMFDLRKVQTGRQISDEYVHAINYILKLGARRYIASAEENLLYPERELRTTMWSKLGDQFFPMPDPRKVSFSTEFIVGHKDGSAWGIDEYGRRPRDDDPLVKKQRDSEWRTFARSKEEWNRRFGRLPDAEFRKYF